MIKKSENMRLKMKICLYTHQLLEICMAQWQVSIFSPYDGYAYLPKLYWFNHQTMYYICIVLRKRIFFFTINDVKKILKGSDDDD